MTAMTGGFLMSVALRQNQSSEKSITRALPWAGMGLCLAVLLGHVAYDVLAHAHALTAGMASPATAAKSDAEPSTQPLDRRVVRVQIQGGQDRDRAGAIRPNRDRGRCRGSDPGLTRTGKSRSVPAPPASCARFMSCWDRKSNGATLWSRSTAPRSAPRGSTSAPGSASCRPRGSRPPGSRRSPPMSRF